MLVLIAGCYCDVIQPLPKAEAGGVGVLEEGEGLTVEWKKYGIFTGSLCKSTNFPLAWANIWFSSLLKWHSRG